MEVKKIILRKVKRLLLAGYTHILDFPISLRASLWISFPQGEWGVYGVSYAIEKSSVN